MWPLYIDMEPSPRGLHNEMACEHRLVSSQTAASADVQACSTSVPRVFHATSTPTTASRRRRFHPPHPIVQGFLQLQWLFAPTGVQPVDRTAAPCWRAVLAIARRVGGERCMSLAGFKKAKINPDDLTTRASVHLFSG